MVYWRFRFFSGCSEARCSRVEFLSELHLKIVLYRYDDAGQCQDENGITALVVAVSNATYRYNNLQREAIPDKPLLPC